MDDQRDCRRAEMSRINLSFYTDRLSIVPSLMFVGAVCGKAEEAIEFYQSVFKNSRRGSVTRYPKRMEPDKEGTIMFADFTIENQWFAATDSAREQKFNFNEAISFIIKCATQDEIDFYWKKLSADPKGEQCGWCKDKFGVSWQVQPTILNVIMNNRTSQ
jgi:predicted 3-demethylubiquinone-9 3-methyltransferase (glyoxalase superfamily)